MTAALSLVTSSPPPVLQMHELDDDALMLLAAGDHRDAFTVLMERHERNVRRYLSRVVDDAHALDLAQETFLRLWKVRARYRSEGRFTVLLYRIARNLAFSHLRWRKLRQLIDIGALDEGVTDVVDAKPLRAVVDDGLALLLRREQSAVLNATLQGLKPALREVLVLRHAEGLDYATIAAIVGISEENARARAHRGAAWLRTELARSTA
jgi:RNA polymerase sigma-70 factor (ECF subfamily)